MHIFTLLPVENAETEEHACTLLSMHVLTLKDHYQHILMHIHIDASSLCDSRPE